MNQDAHNLHQHVARAVTSVLGLDDSNPWLLRALIEHAAQDRFAPAFDLREHIGDGGMGVVADALQAADTPPFRRAGWLVSMKGVLMATEEAWLDRTAGDSADLLASSPIAMALVLDKDSGTVLLCVDASGWAEMGRTVAANAPRVASVA